MKRFFFFILTCNPILSPCTMAQFNRPHVFGCGMIWSEWVGRPYSYDAASMDRIVEMGGTATRATFDWYRLEYTRGVRDWTFFDHQVQLAEERGLVQLAYIGNTPPWALPPGWPPELGYRHPPAEQYAAEFYDYCRSVAARYRGRVKYYFFWNEPNGCSWVNDGCNNRDGYPLYTHWLKRAYAALKEGDPDCIVAAGALDYNPLAVRGYEYIEGIYAEGGRNYFDAISIHPYLSNGIHWEAIHQTRRVMVEHGDAHKPIIIGEYGWDDSGSSAATQRLLDFLNQITQPEYDYVILTNYLCISDLPYAAVYGLCNRELTPRPIWYAYRDFPKNLATATPTPTGPTRTPTHTPTVTNTPPPTPTPQPGNLLNGDFEEGFYPAPEPYQDDPIFPRVKALHWDLWGQNWWKDSGQQGNIYRSPSGAQSVGTDWGSLNNAIYQQVSAYPGVTYRASAWTRVDCTRSGGNHLWRSIGIDPTGGTDPTAASVVYSSQNWTEGVWQQQTVEAVSSGNTLTIFLRAKTENPEGWQWFHVDDAELLALNPPTPTPGTGAGLYLR